MLESAENKGFPVAILSFCPATNLPTFYRACVLVRGVTQEADAGQNVTLLDDALPEDPSARLTVAMITDHSVVGCVVSTLNSDRTCAWYGGLAVDARLRGQGLATQLVEHAVDDRRHMDGYSLPGLAYVRVRRRLNVASYRAFEHSAFIACKPVQKHRNILGPRADHWDEEIARLLLIVRGALPMPLAEFHALGEADVC